MAASRYSEIFKWMQKQWRKGGNSHKYYNVQRKTLSGRLKSKVKDDCSGAGRLFVLSKGQEQKMENREFPLTTYKMTMFAWYVDTKSGGNQFGETGPTEGWWNGFKKRHSESVKLRKPDSFVEVKPFVQLSKISDTLVYWKKS